jgi:hypothetical protein
VERRERWRQRGIRVPPVRGDASLVVQILSLPLLSLSL